MKCKLIYNPGSEEWRNHSGFCSWPTLQFATVDIESLYPSIDLTHLRQVIKSQIFKYYDGEKAGQVAALLDLVLRINDTAFEGEIYRICKGLPTGSPVSVVLASLYLVELDATLRGTPGLCFYKRYIDDLLLLLSRDCLVDVIARLHSFHPNIRVQLFAQGNQNIPFADLQLSIDDQARISHELFIKPQNLFHYVPFTSCHPPFVFKGVVQGEFQRYVRRCAVPLRKLQTCMCGHFVSDCCEGATLMPCLLKTQFGEFSGTSTSPPCRYMRLSDTVAALILPDFGRC